MSWFSFTSKGTDQAAAATQRANGLAELCKQFPTAEPKELERFLKVKDGNVKAAAAHFTRSLEWRAATLPIDPRSDPIVRQLLTNRVVYELPGNAVDGSAVVVCHGPNHKPDDFAKEDTVRAFVHVAATIFERRPADQRWTLLVYAPGGTPVDLKALSAFAGTFKENFPETLAKVVVFPTSPLTPYLWNMCKVFLGKRTAKKVVLLPGGKRPPRLKEFVPVDITPSLFLAADANGVPIPKSQKQRPGEPELLPRLRDFTAETKGASTQNNGTSSGGGSGSVSHAAAEDSSFNDSSSGNNSSSSSGSSRNATTAARRSKAAAAAAAAAAKEVPIEGEDEGEESADIDEALEDLARARKRALSSRNTQGENGCINDRDPDDDDKGGGNGGSGGGGGGHSSSSSGSNSNSGTNGATDRGYEDTGNRTDGDAGAGSRSSNGRSNGSADDADANRGGGTSFSGGSRDYGTYSGSLRGDNGTDPKDGLEHSLAAWVVAVVGSTFGPNNTTTDGSSSSGGFESGGGLVNIDNNDNNNNNEDNDGNAQLAWAAVVGNIAGSSGSTSNLDAPVLSPTSPEVPGKSRSHSPDTTRSAATAVSDLSCSTTTSTASSSTTSSPAHSADKGSSSSSGSHSHLHDTSLCSSLLLSQQLYDLQTRDKKAAPSRGSPYSASRYENGGAANSSFTAANELPAPRDFQRANTRQRRASKRSPRGTSVDVKSEPPVIRGSPLDSVDVI